MKTVLSTQRTLKKISAVVGFWWHHNFNSKQGCYHQSLSLCPTIKFVRKLSADAHSKWHVICPNFSLVGAISGFSRFDIWCVRLSFCMTGILTDQADDFSYGTLYVFRDTWSKSEFCWTILTSLHNLHEDRFLYINFTSRLYYCENLLYRTHAIINCSLYIFCPISKDKSGLWWRAYSRSTVLPLVPGIWELS